MAVGINASLGARIIPALHFNPRGIAQDIVRGTCRSKKSSMPEFKPEFTHRRNTWAVGAVKGYESIYTASRNRGTEASLFSRQRQPRNRFRDQRYSPGSPPRLLYPPNGPRRGPLFHCTKDPNRGGFTQRSYNSTMRRAVVKGGAPD